MLFRRKEKKTVEEEEGLGLKPLSEKKKVDRPVTRTVMEVLNVNVLENLHLSFNGGVKSEGSGSIVLKANTSAPIYSVQIELNKIEGTSIKKKTVFIPSLAPNERGQMEWSMDYKIQPKDTKILEVSRNVTSPNGEKPILITGKPSDVKISFTVKNTSNKRVVATLTQPIPQGATLKSHSESAGLWSMSSNKLVWDKIKLAPGESAELEAVISVTAEESDFVTIGRFSGVFLVDEGTFSGLEIAKVEGKSDVKLTISKKQDAENPELWEVMFELENKNSYPVRAYCNIEVVNGRIASAARLSGKSNAEIGEKNVKIADLSLGGSSKVTLGPIIVASNDVPRFSEEVFGIVKGKISYSSRGEFIGPETNLEVFNAYLTKKVEVIPPREYAEFLGKNEVPTLGDTKIKVITEVKNSGSVPVGVLELSEFIPKGFSAPQNVSIKVGGKNVPETKVSSKLVPTEEVDRDRQLILRISENISKGKSLTVSYTLNSVRPGLNKKSISLVSEARAFINENREPIVLMLPHRETPILGIKRLAYSVRTEKEVSPLGGDEFLVTLVIENQSNIPVLNYKIETSVPKTFQVLNVDPEPSNRVEGNKGVRFEWLVDIDPKEVKRITYKVRGVGEYRIEDLRKTEM